MRNYLSVTGPQGRILQTERLSPECDQYILRGLYSFKDAEPELAQKVLRGIIGKQKDLNIRFHIGEDGLTINAYEGEADFSRIHLLKPEETDWQHAYGFQRRFSTVWDAALYEFFIQALPAREGGGTRVWLKGHHALFDGTSFAVLGRRIVDAYAAVTAGNQVPSIAGVQEICLQKERAYLDSDLFAEDRSFWREHMGGTAAFPEKLPTKNEAADTLPIEFDEDLRKKLQNFQQSLPEPLTNFRLALALLGAYLFRRFDCDAVPVITAYGGRHGGNMAADGSVAMLVNTLVLNIRRKAGQSFTDFALQTGGVVSQTLRHSNYPLESLLEDLQSRGEDTDRLWNFSVVSNSVPRAEFQMEHFPDNNLPFALVFRVNMNLDDKNGLQSIHMCYRRDAFSRQQALRMAQGIKALAAAAVSEPSRPVDRLTILGEEERDTLLRGLQTPPPSWGTPDSTFVDYLRRAASKYPERTALRDEHTSYSYAELDRITDRLAALLEARGPVRGRFVGLGISRRNAFALAIYAVMKAGGAYLPLDPEYPLERVEYMLADSLAPLLITDPEGPKDRLGLARPGLAALNINELLQEAETFTGPVPQAPEISQPAYIIYTSGSTGKPKGVVIPHRGLAAYIAANIEQMGLGAASRVALHSSFSFDAAVLALFPPLCAGGQLHIISEATRFDPAVLYQYIIREKITDIFMTTQFCVEFLRQYELPGCTVSTGGEKLKSVPAHKGRLFNCYGPTEFTVVSTTHLLEPERVYENIPIGRPLGGARHYIVDRNRELLPLGQNGELCLSGPQTAQGYLGRPEATAGAFVENPFAASPGTARMYRTGDLATWNERGEVEYKGRLDDQVKLRGFRVELGEIENAMLRVPGVVFAVVMVKGDLLVAYFQAERLVEAGELRAALRKGLPEYMIPAGFMQLKSMPLSPNGKVDRKKLPELTLAAAAAKAPCNGLQRKIAAIIAEVIGNDGFGVDTNLYQAGMSSLSAIKIVARLSAECKVALNAKDLMRALTVEGIEALVTQARPEDPAPVWERRAAYPLSAAQLGVYYDCAKQPESLIYNIPLAVAMPPSVSTDDLLRALRAVVLVHPLLHARLTMENGELRLARPGATPPDFPIPVEEVEENQMPAIKGAFIRPFDLFAGPLFRLAVFRTPAQLWLLADFHHLVFDGFSADLFLQELCRAYAGREPEAEQASAFDLGLEEGTPEAAATAARAEAYYRELLAELDGPTSVPYDHGPEAEASPGRPASAASFVECAEVEGYCSRHGLTPGSFFLGAAALAVSRFAGNRRLLFSVIHSGRDQARYRNTVGMLVKTLPLALNLEPEERITDYLPRVQEGMYQSIEHQAYPFSRLAADRQWRPEINFAFQDGLLNTHSMNGRPLTLEALAVPDEQNTAKFPLSVEITRVLARYRLGLEYDERLYDAPVMRTFAECLAQVARAMLRSGEDARVRDVGLMTAEQAARVAAFNAPVTPGAASGLHGLFERQAAQKADETALLAVDRNLTFAQLNRAANNLAGALLQRGVSPEDRVAFILPRTSRVFCAMLGILKAGCAFIPVDPEYPAERVRHILDDSGARFILTQGPGAYANGLDIDALLSHDSPDNPNLPVEADQLAYIIYTSGSTGKPKGVMLTHRGIVNYIRPEPANLHVRVLLETDARLVSIATISFDAFLEDAFCTLMNGLPLVFASEKESNNPDQLAALFERTGGSAADFTPSRLLQYMELPAMAAALGRCRYITAGGEKYPPVLYERLRKLAPDAVLLNSYGPTEITIACNARALSGGRISIGKPLWNVVERIVDIDGQPLPPGVTGELQIGGEGVARGYFGNLSMTEDRFFALDGVRYYRSGDLGKWTEDGEVVIFGRNDGQVKLRGLRIELGEIEEALSAVPGIRSCAVLVRPIDGREHLCAYYTASRPFAADELRGILSASLARYMVPTAYCQMEKLPETPSGKTDLRALPEPALAARKKYIAPVTAEEGLFCDIFSRVLEMEQISVDDDFFDLGGSSLLVTRVVIEALERGRQLTFGDVFTHRTPASLAALNFETASKEDAPPDADDVKDYDYGAINTLLEENTLEALRGGPQRSLGNLVLTGATGFLGIHILREFLRTETGMVQCLARGGRLSAEERLKSLLVYYFDDSFDEAFATRIRVLEGDVTNPADFEKLKNRPVDTFINCAANVKHFAAGSEIEDINVRGVEHGIQFCLEQKCRFIQISTTSVAGLSIENEPPENTRLTEGMLYYGQNLDNKYLHSKFLAERLVLEAAATRGLDAKIMRVGNLMARQDDGEFQINFKTNSFIGALKAYWRIGKISFEALGAPTEFAPVDSTSSAILRLAATPAACRVFHPYNNHSVFMGDVLMAMARSGYAVHACEREEFERAYSLAMRDPLSAKDLSPLIAYSNMARNRRATSLESDNSQTTQALYRLGFIWPVTSESYLESFISAISGLGFFD